MEWKTSKQPMSAGSRDAHGFQLKNSQRMETFVLLGWNQPLPHGCWPVGCGPQMKTMVFGASKEGMDHHRLMEEASLIFLKTQGLFLSCATPCGVVGLRGQFPPQSPALPSEILFLGSLRNSWMCLFLSHRKTLVWERKDQKSCPPFFYLWNGGRRFVIGVS